MQLTLTNARIPGERGLMGSLINVVITDGVISDIEFVGATGAIDLTQVLDGESIDVGGRYLIPGMWDTHTHFTSWSLMLQRLNLEGVESAREVGQRVKERHHTHPGTMVGFGWRGSLWAEEPHFSILDEACADEEVYLFSGDGHSVWLNSKALEVRGHAGHPTGLLVEDDCFAIWGSLSDQTPEQLDKAVLDASHAAAARGIVGIVDFEMGWILPDWRRRISNGNDLLQVEFSVYTEYLDRAIETGLRTGDVIASTDGLLRMGNYKVISDGSLNTRTAFCHDPYPGLTGKNARGILNVPYDELVSLMTKASSAGINPSIHAIGDDANTFALNAFEEVGCEGTIEHAQLLAWEDIERFAQLGVIASVQPEHAMDDRDVADVLWEGRTDRCFPFASMLKAGVKLSMGSDAPVAPLDPWLAIASAVERTRDTREPWHPEQRIEPQAALDASARTRIAVGQPADLCLVDIDPLYASVEQLRTMPVALTLNGGRITHNAL